MPLRLFAAAAISLLMPALAAAQSAADPEKAADIKALLAATGFGGAGAKELDKLIGGYQKQLTRVKPEVWDELRKTLDAGSLEGSFAALYDKLLTHEDVKAALAFYSTPAGKRLAAITPQLSTDMARLMAGWQQKMRKDIHEKLNATVQPGEAEPVPPK